MQLFLSKIYFIFSHEMSYKKNIAYHMKCLQNQFHVTQKINNKNINT